MPPNTSNPSSWHCNKIITLGSQWQCFTCILVRVYQHVHKSLNSQTINFHQAYAIILTQRFNNGTLRLKVTRQWPLAIARHNLTTATQQPRYSNLKAHWNDEHSPLGLLNTKSTRYHKTRSRYNECSQYSKFPILKFAKPNLLITAGPNPAATSSNASKKP